MVEEGVAVDNRNKIAGDIRVVACSHLVVATGMALVDNFEEDPVDNVVVRGQSAYFDKTPDEEAAFQLDLQNQHQGPEYIEENYERCAKNYITRNKCLTIIF